MNIMEAVLGQLSWTGLGIAHLLLLLINLYGLAAIAIDKKLAQKGRSRFSERHLLGAALIGGATGVFAGMRIFRHKTKHLKFTLGIPLIILFHIILYYFFAESSCNFDTMSLV